MPQGERDEHADDVSSASAASLFNVLPELLKLPAPQQFERLREHFRTAFLAYHDGLAGWALPEPSRN